MVAVASAAADRPRLRFAQVRWASRPPVAAGRPYPDGPPLRHSGGFGEPTCRACHSGGEPGGAPDGDAAILGLPAGFEPGRRYELTVVVRRPGLARAGFQLAARFASGTPPAALQAGAFILADSARTGVDRDSTAARTVMFVRHTRAGTAVTPAGEARWRVTWVAPREREAVVFHAAVVAADDDNSALGDEVYARAQVVRAAAR